MKRERTKDFFHPLFLMCARASTHEGDCEREKKEIKEEREENGDGRRQRRGEEEKRERIRGKRDAEDGR